MESIKFCLFLLSLFLFIVVHAYDNRYKNSYESSYYQDDQEPKHEKLQIEGTDHNIDESQHIQNDEQERSRLSQERIRFDRYWARLNWGTSRSPNSKFAHVSKRRPSHRYEGESITVNQPLPQAAPLVNSGNNDDDDSISIHPEAELIDPSKVSEQLANLKFMRMEKYKGDY